MLPPWSVVFGIAFGAAIGSFLNVLIYRLPAGLSIVHPPSHCPNCKTRLTALDLFPILSYLVQQGRCRHCRASIPVRYLLVEIVNAAIWAWFWHLHLVQGESWVAFLGLSAFCSCLLALSMIDLRWFIIPDELNAAALIIGLLVAGFASRLATPWDWAEPGRLSLSNALIGATVGAGIFVFISLLGRIAFRKDAMGHGDIKLARAIGACLMAPAAVVSFGLAVMLGLVFGVVGMIYARLHPAIDTSEELESYVPESIASLFFFSILYLLWLDVLYLFLPGAIKRRIDEWLERTFGSTQSEELDDEPPQVGAIPFGPSMALGAILTLIFANPLASLVRAYLDNITGGP